MMWSAEPCLRDYLAKTLMGLGLFLQIKFFCLPPASPQTGPAIAGMKKAALDLFNDSKVETEIAVFIFQFSLKQ
jgi:hypothetical protein